jgi:hypothetical protein
MKQEAVQSVRSVLFAVVLCGLVPAAYGATLHSANNGVDGASCGATATPCRSITMAIANAAPGDTIQVGPGVYGDLNGNGTLGETGEETPPAGCGCMLSINKPVNVISTDGAAATMIDATSVAVGKNVFIIANDVEFGKPDHGFHVTNPDSVFYGIFVNGTDVKIRGNLIARKPDDYLGTGIDTVTNSSQIVLIEQNQVTGWNGGIVARDPGKKASKNQVSLNVFGIVAFGGLVVGNVATANSVGIQLTGSTSAVGNATIANVSGVVVSNTFTGVIQKSNIFGNRSCGLGNNGAPGVAATNNYWGAATGPGPNPADTVCNSGGGTTTTTPFATARFAINPSFEP